MTLRFYESSGTSGDDSLLGQASTATFALAGNDSLTSQANVDWQVLFGGAGNDTYNIGNGSTTIISDQGSSSSDVMNIAGISIYNGTMYAIEIDSRHLVIGSTTTNTVVGILDWENSINQIDSIRLADGAFSASEFAAIINQTASNWTWEQFAPSLGSYSATEIREAIEFYAVRNATLASSGAGAPVGFNPIWYLENYTDIAAAGVDPTQHYLRSGEHEHRSPNAYFDEDYYLEHNTDVSAAVQSGAVDSGYIHFLHNGVHEGRDPGNGYSESEYLARYPDVAAAVQIAMFQSGYEHYILYGAAESRII